MGLHSSKIQKLKGISMRSIHPLRKFVENKLVALFSLGCLVFLITTGKIEQTAKNTILKNKPSASESVMAPIERFITYETALQESPTVICRCKESCPITCQHVSF